MVPNHLIGFAFNRSEDLEIDEEPPPPPSAVAGMDIESPSPDQSLDGGETISGIEEAEETPEPEEPEEEAEEPEEEPEEPQEAEQPEDDDEAKSEADISEMEAEP